MFGICNRCKTGGYLERELKSGENVCLNCVLPDDELVECIEYSEWWEKEYIRMKLESIENQTVLSEEGAHNV